MPSQGLAVSARCCRIVTSRLQPYGNLIGISNNAENQGQELTREQLGWLTCQVYSSQPIRFYNSLGFLLKQWQKSPGEYQTQDDKIGQPNRLKRSHQIRW